MQIENEIFRILQEFNSYGVDLEKRSNLINDLGLDSLSFTQLLTHIENMLKIEISQEELTEENFLTIESMINFVEKKVGERSFK